MSEQLRIFVYGTLKRGYGNHDKYCQGYKSVRPAQTLGRIFLKPNKIPVITVPQFHMIRKGSPNPKADLAAQEDARKRWFTGALPHWIRTKARDWVQVKGELYEFSDGEGRLPIFDRLETFDPSQEDTRYLRVLAPVKPKGEDYLPAWLYVAGAQILRMENWEPVKGGDWQKNSL